MCYNKYGRAVQSSAARTAPAFKPIQNERRTAISLYIGGRNRHSVSAINVPSPKKTSETDPNYPSSAERFT